MDMNHNFNSQARNPSSASSISNRSMALDEEGPFPREKANTWSFENPESFGPCSSPFFPQVQPSDDPSVQSIFGDMSRDAEERDILRQFRDMKIYPPMPNLSEPPPRLPACRNIQSGSSISLPASPLPLDCTKLSFDQRQTLLMELQRLQTQSAIPPASGSQCHSGVQRTFSEDSQALTSSSASGDNITGFTSASNVESPSVWKGELPPRSYESPVFSSKIFVGGVPWDITEEALLQSFCPYGDCRVEWPGREPRRFRPPSRETQKGRVTGYVYIIFHEERSVKALLHDCSQQFGSAGEWYFKLKAHRAQATEIRQVQVIPWVVSDASYVAVPDARLDTRKTVFVGALHGMMTAEILCSIMNKLYGDVIYVGIDTDKYKYPIGSGRVTFSSHDSYFTAIKAAVLEIRTSKFTKKVQIDPFLEESPCMMCCRQPGPYFCRDSKCFSYFCNSCWQYRHKGLRDHEPLMKCPTRNPQVHHPIPLTTPPQPQGGYQRMGVTMGRGGGAGPMPAAVHFGAGRGGGAEMAADFQQLSYQHQKYHHAHGRGGNCNENNRNAARGGGFSRPGYY